VNLIGKKQLNSDVAQQKNANCDREQSDNCTQSPSHIV
jgi:hypothetical protein